VNEVFKYINKRKGILRIKDICENFNTTPRSLQRAFKEETGLSPKDILNLRRMNYAVELITEDRNLHLAELSQMCGFYDQSHFTKEIKKRTGFKPSTIISRNEKVYRNMSKIHFFKS
jgi:AraC-like DNA-binding protein